MIHNLNLGDGSNVGTTDGKIAMDCSVRKLEGGGGYVISTTDFFFPLVDSPYMQGRIGAANVLSDLYAQGIDTSSSTNTNFMLMLLAVSTDMPPEERSICTNKMVEGFRDACIEADNIPITGGQTIMNPWPIIGGVATSILLEQQSTTHAQKKLFVPTDGAIPGDVVVLTKPLGTQIAVNVHQWRKDAQSTAAAADPTSTQLWNRCLDAIPTTEDTSLFVDDMMHSAVCSMARLNRNAGRLMTEYSVHAGTDVTGYGILGHAQNLVSNQIHPDVGIEITTLPCIANTMKINTDVYDFGLFEGTSAETSGGLLLCMPEDRATEYCKELTQKEETAWIVGRVVHDPQCKARIVNDCRVLEV